MNQYSTLAYQLKRGLLGFCEKISEGLTRPKLKFICCMLFGLLKSQSVKLSEIARALNENITLKKTIDRLSRNLSNFTPDSEQLIENYMNEVKGSIDENTIFCIDPGEICKKYSRNQEGICGVYDSSEKKPAKGWPVLEVTALTHKSKLPIPVYSRLYSTKEADAGEETEELMKALRHLEQHFGNTGIRVMDRGMDNVEIYRHCGSEKKFVVRVKTNRNVIHDGETLNILELADRYKGKFRLDHTDKRKKRHRLKISYIPVKLPALEELPLTLIVVQGYDKKDPEPFLLLTNMDACGKQKSLSVVKIYLCRWRIEEYYRFKKTQFGLEDIRVLSLDSLKMLNLLLSILTGWLSILSAKRGENRLVEHLLKYAERIYAIPKFTLYAVADGIFNALSKTAKGIANALKKEPPSQQLSLFKPLRIVYSAA